MENQIKFSNSTDPNKEMSFLKFHMLLEYSSNNKQLLKRHGLYLNKLEMGSPGKIAEHNMKPFSASVKHSNLMRANKNDHRLQISEHLSVSAFKSRSFAEIPKRILIMIQLNKTNR